MADGAAVLADLDARGLVHDQTDRAELSEMLAQGPTTFYYGIDPSADSLHVGHLVGVLAMRRFQDVGHRPLALVGGSTGMIGDPGGRSDERNLLDVDTIAANMAGIGSQLERLLDTTGDNAVRMVNNFDWTGDVSLLDFLRDVGKHVTVNQMLAKDSIRSRLEGERGISYTEFSYMLLQAFDYWWLYKQYDCRLQLGGSDQWGNITAGVDLVRRREATAVHGVTWPLITRADGTKFGKTAAGAVWLDADRTLPYDFHQYFLQADDRHVERLLLQLTLLPVSEVGALLAQQASAPDRRSAQHALADAVTELVHGARAVRSANLAADTLFGTGALTADGLEALRGVVPETELSEAEVLGDLIQLLVGCGLASSKSDARRTLADDGFSANRAKLAGRDTLTEADLIEGRYVLLQKGKKRRHLVVVTDRA